MQSKLYVSGPNNSKIDQVIRLDMPHYIYYSSEYRIVHKGKIKVIA